MASEAEKLAKKIFGIKAAGCPEKKENLLTKRYKIAVFVPVEKTDELSFRMASAGAGNIGNYSVCSFRMKGVGTFIGEDGSDPASGAKGKFEMVEEIRLEMICDKRNLKKVIEQMYEVHPYDEPAYEVYEVLTGIKKHSNNFLKIPLNKKYSLKKILNRINPSIEQEKLPGKMKKIKPEGCVIDMRENRLTDIQSLKKNILYILKTKNKIKAYYI